MTLSISCPNCGKQFRNIKSEMAGKKARCSCGTVVRLGPKLSRNQRRAGKKPTSENRPLDTQTVDSADTAYGDLDDILSGHGDETPLVVRQPESDSTVSPVAGEKTNQESRAGRRNRPSSLGFLAALGSATLAFWFGGLVAVSRFQTVEIALVSGFSETLQSVFLAVFGMADVTKSHQQLFTGLGWALWVVGVALVLFSMAQFANAFFRILFRRSLMGWSDGMTAAMGVCALFLMVSMVFTHTSFTKQQNRLLDEYENPTVLDRGPIGNVDLIRAGVQEDGKTFQKTMLVGAVVPASIFVLSIARLFLKTPDQDR